MQQMQQPAVSHPQRDRGGGAPSVAASSKNRRKDEADRRCDKEERHKEREDRRRPKEERRAGQGQGGG